MFTSFFLESKKKYAYCKVVFTYSFYVLSLPYFYWKQLFMISIMISCCSAVILLSLGRHKPLSKISFPASMPLPFVTNGLSLNIGCICIGFQIGLPSALYSASFSRISIGFVWLMHRFQAIGKIASNLAHSFRYHKDSSGLVSPWIPPYIFRK